MPKRQFWFGLVAGLVIMGLIVGTLAALGLGARWASGSRSTLRARPFGLQPGERGELFGLRDRGAMTLRHFGVAALVCCPGLFLILGVLVVAGYLWKRYGPHATHHDGALPAQADGGPTSEPLTEPGVSTTQE